MIYDKHLSRHSSDASKFLSMPNTITAAKKTPFKADISCATILSAQLGIGYTLCFSLSPFDDTLDFSNWKSNNLEPWPIMPQMSYFQDAFFVSTEFTI